MQRYGARYLERVYSPREQVECGLDPAPLALRFAAKEAAVKCLDGRVEPASWTTIDTAAQPGGELQVELTGATGDAAREAGLTALTLAASAAGDRALVVALGWWSP